jgi:hypothetical protein
MMSDIDDLLQAIIRACEAADIISAPAKPLKATFAQIIKACLPDVSVSSSAKKVDLAKLLVERRYDVFEVVGKRKK